MNTLLNAAGPWLQILLVLSFKGALLALIVGLVIQLMRRRLSPAWRHGLWLLVLVRLAVPDVATSPWSLSRWMAVPGHAPSAAVAINTPPQAVPPASLGAEKPVPVEEAAPAASLPAERTAIVSLVQTKVPWTLWQWLACVWMLGFGVVTGAMVVLHLRMVGRVRRDRIEPSQGALESLRTACVLAGVRRMPALIVTDAVRAPALFGILRPVILLPRDLAASCDPASLNLILLHELAHLQRRDLWSQVATSVIIALHWFNPLVWWAGRRLRAEAEMAADARALRCTDPGEAHRMGEVLLGFANHAAAGWMVWFAAATVLGISENKRDLRRRIEALMDVARGRKTWWAMGLVVFMGLAVTGLTKAPAVEAAQPKGGGGRMMSVTGIVVDEQGAPVAGASCWLRIGEEVNLMNINADAEARKKALERMRSNHRTVTSDENGRFQFEALPESSTYSMGAFHNGHTGTEPAKFTFSPQGLGAQRLVLGTPTRWITGTVTLRGYGTPVKGAKVYAGPNLSSPAYTLMSRLTDTTDDAGHYRIANGSRDASKPEAELLVDAPGMALSTTKFTWQQGGQVIDQVVEPDAGVVGRVVNAEGRPVQGAFVSVATRLVALNGFMRKKDPGISVPSTPFSIWVGSSETDATGAFSGKVFKSLPPEEPYLVAAHPEEGVKYMRLKDWQAGSTLKLERWSTVQGTVTDTEGNIMPGVTVKLIGSVYEGGLTGQSRFSLMSSPETVADERGRYRIEQVLPHSNLAFLQVNGQLAGRLPGKLGSGETRELRLRPRAPAVAPPKPEVPLEQLRRVAAHIITPPGYTVLSDKYEVLMYFTPDPYDGAAIEKQAPDAQGRILSKMIAPGNYTMRLVINPKDTGMNRAASSGRSLRFNLEQDARQQTLDLGDFKLEASDFEFQPAATAAAAPGPARRETQQVDAPVAGNAQITTWACSNGFGISREMPLKDGKIVGKVLLSTLHRFIIRGVRSDGSYVFSATQSGLEDGMKPLQSPMTFNPAAIVEGRLLDLPADYVGGGWVAAAVTVEADIPSGTVIKGYIPTMQYNAWAPVQRDGSFHFAALPRGTMILSGFAQGRITYDSLTLYNSQMQMDLRTAKTPVKLKIGTDPGLEKRLQLLGKDGHPFAGATVSLSMGNNNGIQAFITKGRAIDPADSAAYEAFKKIVIPGHRVTSDAAGFAVLGNLPAGPYTLLVEWTDPRTTSKRQQKVEVKPDSSEVQAVNLK